MKTFVMLLVLLCSAQCYGQWGDDHLGTLGGSPYARDSLSNPYGAGSPFRSDGINNPYSPYGSPYSTRSATNPYATRPPKIYSSDGTYYGELSANPFRRDSTSNPYGRYGSPYSRDSINNPYGAGNPYRSRQLYVYPGRR
jgi:hypothetical protein